MKGAYNQLLLLTASRIVARSNRRGNVRSARRIEMSKLYEPFYLLGYEKTQWAPKEELDRLTEKRLRFLVSYAYRNVPYYHDLMKSRKIDPDSIRSVNDLARMPILTREIIRDNFESLTSRAVSPDQRILMETGGSTGVSLTFYSTQSADTRLWASMLRARFWQGVVRGFRMAQMSGIIPEPSQWKENEAYFPAFDISEEIFSNVAEKLREFRPQYVTGYASYLTLLANYLKEKGIEDIRPYAVETQSEMLFPHMRGAIEEAFSCPVFDHYGCKETSVKASECSLHEGYHISVENGIIETVRDGERVLGESGSILMTDFWNLAMPFIRYEVGDSASLGEDPCSCGRSLPLMKSLLGRNNDILVLPQGRMLPGEFFPVMLSAVAGIRQFQVVQNDLRSITVKIAKAEGFSDDDERLLTSNLAKWLGDEVRLDIDYVERIPLSRLGKQKIVVSKIGSERLL